MQKAGAAVLILALWFGAGLHAQAPAESRTFLLVLDDLHLEFRSTPRVRELVRRVMAALTRDGDLWAIVSTGTSSIAVAPTPDRRVLESAIARVVGNGLTAQSIFDARRRVDGALELRRRATLASSTAADAIRGVSASRDRGPFTILYVSAGYDADLTAEPTQLIEAAVDASAPVHAIDPRSLSNTAAPQGVSQADWEAYLSATRAVLSTLATETRGTAVLSVRDLDVLLSRLANGGR